MSGKRPGASVRVAALALAAMLGGCSTLPRLHPGMARVDAKSVHVQSASGRILSAQQSQALIEKAAKGGAALDMLARHVAVEEAVAEAPLTTGNRVVLLQDGPATYGAMLDAIAKARDHVHLETYILDDDETGRRFADALLAKAARGVTVRLIHDAVGTIATPAAFFERLKAGGVQVVAFNPVNPLQAKAGWNVNQRDHRKILVVDGSVAFLGGINISGVYSGGSLSGSGPKSSARARSPAAQLPWRDTHLQVEGPAVALLQRLFLDTWKAQKGPPLPPGELAPPPAQRGDAIVRVIGSHPEEPFSRLWVTLMSAIHSAQREILITNAYFVPDAQLARALVGAAQRGVEVKLLLPSVTDSKLVFHAGRAHYDELLRGGVRIFERKNALLHAKTAVVDGVWATVGTTNLDWRSFVHNQEVNAVVLGTEFGARMRAEFERDLAQSVEITREAWARRPLGNRVQESLAQLWEYWL